MKVIFSNHANDRMKQYRQHGLTKGIVAMHVKKFPGKFPENNAVKIRLMHKRRRFDVAVSDKNDKRLIVTIIGSGFFY